MAVAIPLHGVLPAVLKCGLREFNGLGVNGAGFEVEALGWGDDGVEVEGGVDGGKDGGDGAEEGLWMGVVGNGQGGGGVDLGGVAFFGMALYEAAEVLAGADFEEVGVGFRGAEGCGQGLVDANRLAHVLNPMLGVEGLLIVERLTGEGGEDGDLWCAGGDAAAGFAVAVEQGFH